MNAGKNGQHLNSMSNHRYRGIRITPFTNNKFYLNDFHYHRLTKAKITSGGNPILSLTRVKGTNDWWDVDFSMYELTELYSREIEGVIRYSNSLLLNTINNLWKKGWSDSDLEISVIDNVGYSTDMDLERSLFYHVIYHGDGTSDCIAMSDTRELECARDVNEVMGYPNMVSKYYQNLCRQHREGRKNYIKSLRQEDY